MPNRKFIRWFFFTVILAAIIAFIFPQGIEQFYGGWVYPSIRLFFNTLSFISPLPLVFFFLLWFFLLVGIYVVKRLSVPKLSPINRVKNLLVDFFYFCLFMIAFFYWSWGLNYFRSDEVERMGLKPHPVDSDRLIELFDIWTEKTNKSRGVLTKSWSHSPDGAFNPKFSINGLEASYLDLMSEYGFFHYRHLPVFFWKPPGILMRNSTVGFYFPLTGEATVDSGLHPFQIPFTTSHEMAHSLGFTDEGICNLLALIVCLRSEDPFVIYSGHLSFWRYIANEIRRIDHEYYTIVINDILAPEVREDLIAIYENSLKYPDWFPGLQRKVYDTYLRAHGITEGMASYNEVLMLAESYFNLFTQSEDDID